MTIIYVLLVAHFVGDFICQSDWMAINKWKRWDALAAHVFVYSVVLQVAIVSWVLLEPARVLTVHDGRFLLVNTAAHFVQDAITSRITSRLWFSWVPKYPNTRHWFFVAIGADQLLHYVCLFVTAEWWLR